MKKLLFPFFIFIVSNIFAQSNEQTPNAIQINTDLEKFISKKGVMLVKEFIPIGEINGSSGTQAKLTAVKVFRPGEENNATKGLRIQLSSYKKEGTAFIDFDEANSLIEAIEYMIELSKKWNTIERNYTEVIFNAKDYISFGFYTKEGELSLFVSINKYPNPYYFDEINKLAEWKTQISKGLELLK